jgi:hypothetical protein
MCYFILSFAFANGSFYIFMATEIHLISFVVVVLFGVNLCILRWGVSLLLGLYFLRPALLYLLALPHLHVSFLACSGARCLHFILFRSIFLTGANLLHISLISSPYFCTGSLLITRVAARTRQLRLRNYKCSQ